MTYPLNVYSSRANTFKHTLNILISHIGETLVCYSIAHINTAIMYTLNIHFMVLGKN